MLTAERLSGRLAERVPGLIALLLPVLAGIGCMAWLDAPPAYIATNAIALAIGSFVLVALPGSESLRAQRLLALVLLTLLFAPLLTGPDVNGIARWLPLGPVTLHTGMMAVPSLAVLAARDPDYAAPLLLVALFAALVQPDAATAFALTIAAVGTHHGRRDWKLGATAVAGFLVMIAATLRGELPAQPFVERVLEQYAHESPAIALALFGTLVGSFALIALAAPLERAARLALAGSLFGFAVMALMNNYPAALIGHGAAPIIGYGLALGLVRKPQP